MIRTRFSILLVTAVICSGTGFWQASAAEGESAKPAKSKKVLKARAVLQGAPGSGISGEVVLTQTEEGIIPTVLVEATIFGLKAGARHGMHVHEVGNCSNTNPATGATGAFLGAGGHFDPGPNSNSNADANHPFHMGDLPNVVVDEKGVGHLRHRTSRITLSAGPLSVFDPNDVTTPFDDTDSAIILHAEPDQGTTGVAGGAGGARIACGIVDRTKGFDSPSGK